MSLFVTGKALHRKNFSSNVIENACLFFMLNFLNSSSNICKIFGTSSQLNESNEGFISETDKM